MENPKIIVKLSKTEFETSEGIICPIPCELEEPIPSIDEFQKIYDEWFRLFQKHNLIVNKEIHE
jgi:hypothetical protein